MKAWLIQNISDLRKDKKPLFLADIPKPCPKENQSFSVEKAGGHMRYNLDFPEVLVIITAGFYSVPISISPFVSSVKGMLFLGLANLFTFSMALCYYQDHLISVWCFFVPVPSVLVMDLIVRMNAKRTAGVLDT